VKREEKLNIKIQKSFYIRFLPKRYLNYYC